MFIMKQCKRGTGEKLFLEEENKNLREENEDLKDRIKWLERGLENKFFTDRDNYILKEENKNKEGSVETNGVNVGYGQTPAEAICYVLRETMNSKRPLQYKDINGVRELPDLFYNMED